MIIACITLDVQINSMPLFLIDFQKFIIGFTTILKEKNCRLFSTLIAKSNIYAKKVLVCKKHQINLLNNYQLIKRHY